MKSIIVYGMIFLAGAATGSGVSYLVLKKKFAAEKDDELAEVRAYYKKKVESGAEFFDEMNKKMKEIANENRDKYEKAAEKSKNRKDVYSKDREDMQTLYNHMFNKEDEEDMAGKESPKEAPSRPYMISPEQYSNEYRHFAKVPLTYYADNETLVDGNDDPIDDIAGTVGFKALEHFGEYEEDIVNVRNEALGVDYEVTRIHDSFDFGEYNDEDDW